MVHYSKRWEKALKKGGGNDYDFLNRVIDDANTEKKILCHGKYYSCAKFVRDNYNKFFYKRRYI